MSLMRISGTDIFTKEYGSIMFDPRKDVVSIHQREESIKVCVNEECANISREDLKIR